MQVTILGRTIDRKAGTGKKSGKEYSGYFVTFGYKKEDIVGLETRSLLYTDDMLKKNDGYLPSPGDVCDVQVGFNGFIESLTPVSKK